VGTFLRHSVEWPTWHCLCEVH